MRYIIFLLLTIPGFLKAETWPYYEFLDDGPRRYFEKQERIDQEKKELEIQRQMLYQQEEQNQMLEQHLQEMREKEKPYWERPDDESPYNRSRRYR